MRDIETAIDYYVETAGEETSLGFINALESALEVIASTPGTGAPRYGELLGLPGLRHKRTGHFPYLVFYVEREDHIDVWRVLHVRRNIPASLNSDEDQELQQDDCR